MYKCRVLKELSKMPTRSEDSILKDIFFDDPKEGKNHMIVSARILGSEDTPYHNGVFHLEIYISEKYPFVPPSVKFITKIYHPNIDNAGRILLDLFKMPPASTWQPIFGLLEVIYAIRMLIVNPNPDDPLMPEIAHEYKLNPKLFHEKALEYTKKYAMIQTQ